MSDPSPCRFNTKECEDEDGGGWGGGGGGGGRGTGEKGGGESTLAARRRRRRGRGGAGERNVPALEANDDRIGEVTSYLTKLSFRLNKLNVDKLSEKNESTCTFGGHTAAAR